MLHARRYLSSCLSVALALACNPPSATPNAAPGVPADPLASAEQRGPATSGGPVHPAESVAELTAVYGPAGVRSEDLAEGTFLGAGARLRAGQRLQVPPGTMAELRLGGGTLLRLNEDTRLTLPDGPDSRALVLEAGELVAIVATGQPPLSVRAGADTLDIASGEARALVRGERRSYDVVYGSARLRSDGQEHGLGPGAHIEAPLAAAVQPQISLRPLEDTEWSRTFEVAAAMVDSVPPGVGSLTARRAGTSAELYKLSLTEQKVHVSISGRIARTEIEQTFYNEAGEVLEGTYRFPLPADASISGLSLLVGKVWMNAEMLEKERANRIFRQIVDATIPRDPALLEWEKGNIFKMRIFPIPGRGARKIRLSYTQVLPAVGDQLRYRYPIAGASSGASGEEIGEFEFTVDVDRAQLPPDKLANIVTPMAQLERRELPDRVELSTRKQRFRPVHDLGVDIPLSAAEQRLHSETHLDRDGQAYFMLALKPDLQLPVSDRPVHYAFVLDRSHSMTPELWTVARSLVQALSTTLGPDDRMTVLACDAACDAAPGGLAPAAQAMPAVDAFLDPQILAGASDIGGMMRAAAEALGEADARPQAPERVIVYLGDGNASAGELAPDELHRNLLRPLAGTRVQAVALGARSDILLLDALTRSTGGDLLRADAKDDLRGLVRQLRLRAEVPVARSVALTLPPGMVHVHPHKLAAVRAGETVLLVGKLSGPVHGPLELRATSPSGQVVTERFDLDLEAAPSVDGGRHTHLPRTWAQREIDALTATEGKDARAEIIDISRQYTVLSRYTALLVLENDAMFREFNVVRQAGKTTGWSGQLGVPTGAPAPIAAPSAEPPPAPAPREDRNHEAKAETTERSEKAKESPMPPMPPAARRSRDVEEEDPRDRQRGPAPDSESADDHDEEAPASQPESQRPPQSRAPSAPAKKDSSASKPIQLDDSYDGSSYGQGGGYSGRVARPAKPAPRWKISPAAAPSYDAMAKLEPLRQSVLRDPTSRPAHRKLVQQAIRVGAPEAFTFAIAWSQADPDHAPAMLAVADLLAARGEAIAMRAYGSAVEVNPFDAKLQTRLADALASKGDLARSCAHRRALVSIDPKRAEHHLQLARCLTLLGCSDLVRDAAEDGVRRAAGNTADLRAALSGALRPAALRAVHGPLKATLTWFGAGDLDIAFIDSRGRRLSALRPEGLLVEQLVNGESIAMISLNPQTVAVEVTRFSGQGPVSGELKIRTPELSRSYPFTIDQGSLRLANVTYSPQRYGYGY